MPVSFYLYTLELLGLIPNRQIAQKLIEQQNRLCTIAQEIHIRSIQQILLLSKDPICVTCIDNLLQQISEYLCSCETDSYNHIRTDLKKLLSAILYHDTFGLPVLLDRETYSVLSTIASGYLSKNDNPLSSPLMETKVSKEAISNISTLKKALIHQRKTLQNTKEDTKQILNPKNKSKLLLLLIYGYCISKYLYGRTSELFLAFDILLEHYGIPKSIRNNELSGSVTKGQVQKTVDLLLEQRLIEPEQAKHISNRTIVHIHRLLSELLEFHTGYLINAYVFPLTVVSATYSVLLEYVQIRNEQLKVTKEHPCYPVTLIAKSGKSILESVQYYRDLLCAYRECVDIHNTDTNSKYNPKDSLYLRALLRAKNTYVLLAYSANENPLAFAIVQIHKGPISGLPETDNSTRYMYLHEIQVIQQCRGYGLGTYLMQQLEEFAKTRSVDYVLLTVHRNNTKAYKWYLQIGFIPASEQQSYILMVKQLE